MEARFSFGFLKLAGLLLASFAGVIAVFFFTNIGSYSLSGEIETETTALENFDVLSFSGSGTIELKPGAERQIEVTTDTNIINKVQIEQKDREVLVSLANLDYLRSLKLEPDSIRYVVTSPQYSQIKTSGSFILKSNQEISGDEILIETTGKTELDLNILTNKLDLHTTGQTSGSLSGDTLGTTTIAANGDSSLDLESFNGKLIRYTGNGNHTSNFGKPEVLQVEINGVGFLEYLETPQELSTKIQGRGVIQSKTLSEVEESDG